MVAAGAVDVFGKDVDGLCAPDILGAGQRLITGMRATTGQGRPDSGDMFALGAAGFLSAAQTVGAAYPRDSWQGAGAAAYTAATRRVAGRTEALAVLDRGVHEVIDREAAQIVRRRETLDQQFTRLSSLRRATGSLAAIPGVGIAMRSAVEMAAVTAAVDVCGTELRDLAADTATNADRLRRIAGDYQELTDAAAVTGEIVPSDETEPSDENRAPDETGPTGEPGGVPAPMDTVGADVPATPPLDACPASCAATSPQADEQSAMQGDLMSGLTSAFGAVGGMLGAAVAPLAAVLSGVVSAAGQIPSSTSQATAVEPPEEDAPNSAAECRTDEPPRDSPPEPDTGPADTSGAAPAVAEPQERVPNPQPSAPPPAATRPPQ
ncbi:hypothetical protein FK535_25990 [Mycolicibacterium sp. 018/SC-01/001]|uniref:EspA/EspE family type VII secretion system effector n=1 Tax=Mycolicibacterium sp. 018/SC-01/001 TaxID=2592069 RepID=UPI00117D9DCC|nr:EspA/EspE family type VII secretion system effector [Mycolicibacterium sp. 018/SC-01/001]TRW78211.1 hypothetical protein FK535_25990 [Mycolicibacterium sp. 018/SC-01/001]